MDKERRGILIGMVLGDGYIPTSFWAKKNGHDSKLTIVHSRKQKDYIEYKTKLLSDICGKSFICHDFNNRGYPGVRVDCFHKYFRILGKWIYKDGVKVYNARILNYLTPHGIAIWYMDDGSLSHKRRNGKIHGRELFLNTYVPKEQNQLVIDYFDKKWNVKFKIVKDRKSYRLRCGSHEAMKFFNIINSYIIPSMLYKINMKYKILAPSSKEMI